MLLRSQVSYLYFRCGIGETTTDRRIFVERELSVAYSHFSCNVPVFRAGIVVARVTLDVVVPH